MEVDTAELLSRGEIEILGLMPDSSNVTMLVEVSLADDRCLAIYKPQMGEAPLWDFPDGLYRREVAAYELSKALGWEMVPTTVLVDDAPHGPGSLQRFVQTDYREHFLTLVGDQRYDAQLRRIAVFDLMANSADRKSGHCILDGDGHIWAIDNGLCFHAEPKLRTVIWSYARSAIPAELIADMERLVSRGLPDTFDDLLSPEESQALIARTRRIVREGTYPYDPTGRLYPWPLI